MLSGLQVPLCVVYKYLGFPQKCITIDFNAHFNCLVAHARTVLDHCRQVGETWLPGVCLTIFKSFLRPMVEYGMPLALTLSNGMGDQNCFTAAKRILDDCLRWVLPQAAQALTAAAVLSVPPISTRSDTLGACFVLHIAHMPNDHPAHAVLTHFLPGMPQPQRLLLPRTKANPTFIIIDRRHWAEPNTSFDTHLQQWCLHQLEDESCTAWYISRQAHKNNFGTDSCLFL